MDQAEPEQCTAQLGSPQLICTANSGRGRLMQGIKMKKKKSCQKLDIHYKEYPFIRFFIPNKKEQCIPILEKKKGKCKLALLRNINCQNQA